MDNNKYRIDRFGSCAPKETVTFNEDGWGNGITFERNTTYPFEHYGDNNEFCVHIGNGYLFFNLQQFRSTFDVMFTFLNKDYDFKKYGG